MFTFENSDGSQIDRLICIEHFDLDLILEKKHCLFHESAVFFNTLFFLVRTHFYVILSDRKETPTKNTETFVN